MVSMRESGNEAIRRKAFEAICETYWFPLYAFARHRGISKHDAEDAVQGFFYQVGTADYFEKAEQERGKLRTYLLTGFTRYLKDLREFQNAQKRGGGQVVLSLNVDQAEEWLHIETVVDDAAAVMQFERQWASTIIRKALERVKDDSTGTEKGKERFEILHCYLVPDQCELHSRDDAAKLLGISTDACDKAIQRLRNSFRLAVKEVVISTLANPNVETIHEEIQQLQRALLK